MIHPWKLLIEEIRNRNWTQKQFAVFVWKKNSEVNELIKWKRNITIQWDLILSEILWTPEKYWINLQTDYDYEIAKAERKKEQNEKNTEDYVILWDWQRTPEDFDWDLWLTVENTDIMEKENIEENIEKFVENTGMLTEEDKNNWKKFNDDLINNIAEDKSASNIIDEEEVQKKKELKKIFINF